MADVGRPSKYTPEVVKTIKKLIVLGLSNKGIAEFLEINEDTLYEWQKVYPEFSDLLKKGRMEADAKVARSLYRRAVGMRIREVTYERTGVFQEIHNDADGSTTTQEVYKKKVVVKQVIPDVAAQTLWLKNRQPDTWRDNKGLDHNFNGPVTFLYSEQAGNEPIADE